MPEILQPFAGRLQFFFVADFVCFHVWGRIEEAEQAPAFCHRQGQTGTYSVHYFEFDGYGWAVDRSGSRHPAYSKSIGLQRPRRSITWA